MPGGPRWVKIFDVNPRVIARHTAPITCQVNQVAASIRDWFPNANATIRDTLTALQRTLSVDGYVEGLCRLLNVNVETVSDDADQPAAADQADPADGRGETPG
ncbi:MAG TPA: hypothetical protein VF299_08190 [Mycobacterium sp.]